MTDLQAYQGKKVLIPGGLGFIGSNLAIRLVELGAQVTLTDSLIPEYGGNLFNIADIKNQVEVNISDVRDTHAVNAIVQKQDIMFNLAGTLSHIDSMTDPMTDLEINCRSQLSLLEACRLHNPDIKIVFSGTRGQYGKASRLPVIEDHPMEPTDVNGINNLAAEKYHLLYNDVHGIRSVSLRLTNTFGPRHQMKHARQGYLNWFVRLAIDDQDITIFGEGQQKRDFNYVDDVVQALLLAGLNEDLNGQAFNLGGGRGISLRESAEKIVQAAGRGRLVFKDFPEHLKSIEIGDYHADFSKFNQATAWVPATSFEKGLEKTVAYYQKHQENYWS